MKPLAVVREDGLVVTFVRPDTPPGWQPPPGCTLVPEDRLPAGWRMALPPPQPVPESITAVQARWWLLRHGITLGAVTQAIDQIADPLDRELVRAWWEYEPVLRRDSVQVSRWADAVGMTAAQLDDAFRDAVQPGVSHANPHPDASAAHVADTPR